METRLSYEMLLESLTIYAERFTFLKFSKSQKLISTPRLSEVFFMCRRESRLLYLKPYHRWGCFVLKKVFDNRKTTKSTIFAVI